MMLFSRFTGVVALLLAVVTLSACTASSRVVRTYDGALQEQPAVLFKSGDIEILSVDGKPVTSYLLDSLEMNYELLPGKRTVAFRYSKIWAEPGRKQASEKGADEIRSEPQQVTFDAVSGQTYRFDYPAASSRQDAERIAANFEATLIDQNEVVVATSGEYVEPVVQEALATTSNSLSAAGDQLSNLDALKVLWEKTSAEDKKEFLRWAFQ